MEKKDKAFDKVKQQLEDRQKKIESVLNKTASDSDLEELHEQLHYLEDAEKGRQTTMQESYNKRFNIQIHGLEENSNSVWETIYSFMVWKKIATLRGIQYYLMVWKKIATLRGKHVMMKLSKFCKIL